MSQDLADAAVTLGAVVGMVVGAIALVCFLNWLSGWIDRRFGGFGFPTLAVVVMLAFVAFVFWGLLAGGHVQ